MKELKISILIIKILISSVGLSSLSKLEKAKNLAPGTFLTPPEYSYEVSEFNEIMGKTSLRTLEFFRKKETIEQEDLEKALDGTAKTRREYAFKTSVRNKMKVGINLPDTEEQSYEMLLYFVKLARPLGSEALNPEALEKIKKDGAKSFKKRGELWDFVTSFNRQKNIYPLVKRIFDHNGEKKWSKIEIDGEEVRLSFVEKDLADCYTIKHPSYREMANIRALAYKKLRHSMNNWNPEEAQCLNDFAESYRLLCHATPYINGSPSILESVLDGFLRLKGLAFPMKKKEPFWNALLWEDSRGPYTWKEFISNFE